MYTSFQFNTAFITSNIIKRQLKYHISDMFQLLYKAIFRLQFKRQFDVHLLYIVKIGLLVHNTGQ